MNRCAVTSMTHPGSLIHVDVTKFANIPDGGGHRFVGRQQGDATPSRRRTAPASAVIAAMDYRPNIGNAFVHTVIDDHSRVAYAEICADEKAVTAIGVLHRAVAWFADHGVIVERVLSDNGSAYKSFAWRDACAELRITHKRTRPYRPQTNGKIERFHRTLADGWAYARLYESHRTAQHRATGLAALLQSPPSPLRHRRPATGHQTDQPPWTSHLDSDCAEHGCSLTSFGEEHYVGHFRRRWVPAEPRRLRLLEVHYIRTAGRRKRMSHHQPTKSYGQRQLAVGHTRMKLLRKLNGPAQGNLQTTDRTDRGA